MFWVRNLFRPVDFTNIDFTTLWPGGVATGKCDPDQECKHPGVNAVSAGDLLSGDGPFSHEANQYLHPPRPERK